MQHEINLQEMDGPAAQVSMAPLAKAHNAMLKQEVAPFLPFPPCVCLRA
jgi:hypothetical protein